MRTLAGCLLALLLPVLFAACTPTVNVGDDTCTTDADCVPASCCHADACVAASNAPECGDVLCTLECQPGTMDCGGGCFCDGGRCAAQLAD